MADLAQLSSDYDRSFHACIRLHSSLQIPPRTKAMGVPRIWEAGEAVIRVPLDRAFRPSYEHHAYHLRFRSASCADYCIIKDEDEHV